MALGAALGMLYAPQSGKELRQKMRSKVDDGLEKLGCQCNDLKDKVKDKVEEKINKVEHKLG